MEINKTEILEDVVLMVVKAPTFPAGIQEAWNQLHSKISFPGRKYNFITSLFHFF